MKVISSVKDMSEYVIKTKKRNQKIGLVATMGTLHKGHFSLIKKAKKKCDIVIVSIFLNPLAFGAIDGQTTYPSNIKEDKKKLKSFEPVVLFQINEKDFVKTPPYCYLEVGPLSKQMPSGGRFGPAVATIVAKLFNIVKPDFAFFGEKDYRQQLIIKTMARDLNFDNNIKIITVKTVREPDGLATSSRNRFLTQQERKAAPRLYKTLLKAKRAIRKGKRHASQLHSLIIEEIQQEPLIKLDYINICDADTLENLEFIKKSALIEIDAYLGKTRLLDNMIVTTKH